MPATNKKTATFYDAVVITVPGRVAISFLLTVISYPDKVLS